MSKANTRRYFGIQEAAFSGKLNVGLLNPANTEFLGGEDIVDDDGELAPGIEDYLSRLHHEDCTDMVIRVVAEHILKHYNGGLAIDYKDGVKYELQITRTTVEATA
ncbi:hypothetical protein ACT17_11395 [Mycolicibacterium conceptionense]|jgi:hypothetical protein|uniref:Uncharacterized protein n=1 Tax=Mycolicibacterium conceptionense TaxID=451644 RepID=A0A0J8U9L9_9MYCO|nr:MULTISPECIES: hypothetical protein [Mycobacteriaceae]KMV18248.1 hypothetical protein ACT17_11395 [Mycolicibacterium conceptionense]OBF76564.1 hypothetical protein A5751_23885 [Mycolicibacterium fortuitum]TMS50256.1 hypothetical protein E0T84_24600 [Mycobacterium sp. DBP42]